MWKIETVPAVSIPVWAPDSASFTLVGNSPTGRPGLVYQFQLPASGLPYLTEWRAYRETPYEVAHRGASSWSAAERAEHYDKTLRIEPPAGQLMIGHYWAGDRLSGVLYETRETGELAISDGDTVELTGIVSTVLPDGTVEEAGESRALGAEGFLGLDATPSRNHRAPFQHAIHDTATGRVIGSAGRQTVAFAHPALADTSERLSDALKSANVELISISASEADGHTVVLAKSPDGKAEIIGADGYEKPAWRATLACGSVAASEIAVRYENWGSADRPLPVTVYDLPGQNPAIVYLHGGPGTNVRSPGQPRTVADLLGYGFEVYAVETSGATGAGVGLATRIAVEGASAQAQDAQTIGSHIETLKTAHGNVGIYAESFGGSLLAQPALRTADFTVGVVPYLVHRLPETWTDPAPSAIKLRAQNNFEDAFFGARNSEQRSSFMASLAHNTESWRPSKPTLLVFAGRDESSQSTDIPEENAGLFEILVVEDAFHSSAASTDKARRVIETFLRAQR